MKGERPTFPNLKHELDQPDSILLHWTDEDRSNVNPEATIIGAPLNHTEQLYMDLQRSYVVTRTSVGPYEVPVRDILLTSLP